MEPASSGTEQAVLYQSYTNVPEAFRRAMTSVYESFARELTMQLSAYFRSALTVKYLGMEECTFGQYMASRQPCSCAGAIKAPSEVQLLLDMGPAILYGFVEAMLGGKAAGKPAPNRAPTDIEKQLLTLVMTTMTTQLEVAWRTVAGISLQFGGIEKETQVARFLSSADVVALARFELSLGEQNGHIAILTPGQAAEGLLESIEAGVSAEVDIPEQDRISSAIMDSSVRFDVWLDGVSVQLRDLVQLREGYVIKFDYPTERNLESTLNGAAGFPGQVVSTGRKRAFLIQGDTLA